MNSFTQLSSLFHEYFKVFWTSLPKIAIGITAAILVCLLLSFIIKKSVNYFAQKAEDPLLLNFIGSVLKITNYVLGVLIFLYAIGLESVVGSILAAAGVSAFVIGFAFKDIGENLLAGIMLAFKRPFGVGDTVESKEITGNIVKMTLRETHLKTFDGKDVFIPNAQILKNPFFNYTIDGYLRRDFTIGVDYESDLATARATILHELNQIEGILQEDKKPSVYTMNLSSSTIDITAFFWVDTFDTNYNALELHSLALRNCIKALENKGINMPGNIIELTNYNNHRLAIQP